MQCFSSMLEKQSSSIILNRNTNKFNHDLEKDLLKLPKLKTINCKAQQKIYLK